MTKDLFVASCIPKPRVSDELKVAKAVVGANSHVQGNRRRQRKRRGMASGAGKASYAGKASKASKTRGAGEQGRRAVHPRAGDARVARTQSIRAERWGTRQGKTGGEPERERERIGDNFYC